MRSSARTLAGWPPSRRTRNGARVWDAETGRLVSECRSLSPFAFDLHFSADSRLVLAAGWSRVRLFDAATGDEVIPMLKHAMGVPSASFSPDGRRILTASEDRTVRVWDVATGHEVISSIKLEFGAGCAAFSPDGERIITGTHDGVAQVWSARDSRPLSPAQRHGRRITRVAFSPDGRFLLTAGGDGMVRLWAAPLGQPEQVLAHESLLRSAAFSADGRRIVTAQWKGNAFIWDAATSQQLVTLSNSARVPDQVFFNRDGREVVAAHVNARTLDVWNAQTGEKRLSLEHEGFVFRARYTSGERRIVTLSTDAATFAGTHCGLLLVKGTVTAQTWDAASGSPLTPPLRLVGSGQMAELTEDGRLVATGFEHGTVRVWDTYSGRPVTLGIKPSWQPSLVEFSPDGTLLATADGDVVWHPFDGRAELWEVATGRQVARLRHKGGVAAIAFSRDGQRVATASLDGTARVWEASTGEPITPPLGHEWVVLDAEFSPDGQFVVTAGTDTAVRIWDAVTGEPAAAESYRIC